MSGRNKETAQVDKSKNMYLQRWNRYELFRAVILRYYGTPESLGDRDQRQILVRGLEVESKTTCLTSPCTCYLWLAYGPCFW